MASKDDVIISLEIPDGHTIKSIFSLIANEVKSDIPITFTPEMVEISFRNANGTGLHHFVLEADKFANYIFNHDEAELILTIPAKEMLNNTKGLGKKDGITLIHMRDSNQLVIQHLKSNSREGSEGAFFVPVTQDGDARMINYSEPSEFNGEIAVNIEVKTFTTLCSDINTSKCTRVLIEGKSEALVFQGINKTDEIKTVRSFSANSMSIKRAAPATKDDKVPIKLSLPAMICKSLSKLHNVTPNAAMVRINYSLDQPLIRIEVQVGAIGNYRLFLRSDKK